VAGSEVLQGLIVTRRHPRLLANTYINEPMRRLILKSFQSPGDILMMTAAVRDLHAACPGQFQTDVRTAADALWLNNPRLTRLQEGTAGVETVKMEYPLIHQSNQRPYHFIHGYAQFLEQHLKVRIPVTRFHGDVYLSAEEKQAPVPGKELGVPDSFWIVVAGGKNDFTAKWWNPAHYQKVVDHFQGRIPFVQCGEQGHWHPRLSGTIDLVGKTSLRDFVRLMYHAAGVLCPVTFAMHLAAAVETMPGRPKKRPCVVVAGGREPPHWEAYPHHQFISTIGALPCCAEGGCWKSRCQLIGDGDDKDRRNVCEMPVDLSPELRIPRCMNMITPEDVIRRIEMYFEGTRPWTASRQIPVRSNGQAKSMPRTITKEVNAMTTSTLAPQIPVDRSGTKNVLLEFRHGLGDAVQLAIVLKHLRHYHPTWNVDVNAQIGKHTIFQDLCAKSGVMDRSPLPRAAYDEVHKLDWSENRASSCHWPSTKPSRCLQDVFRLTPIAELCRYSIHISERAKEMARAYLQSICKSGPNETGRFPAVLIHYQGNTSRERKDLPDDLIREVCEVSKRCGMVPVILDWDRRSSLVDGVSIHNPGTGNNLWGGFGTGDGEVLAALIEASTLMIGVDSGPLHVAGATSTPTIGVWTHHHPVHFFDLADNVIHLVPGDHESYIRAPSAGESGCKECQGCKGAAKFFTDNYRHRVYKQLYVDVLAQVESMLTGQDFEHLATRNFLGKLSSHTYGEQYYKEHRMAGLDYLTFDGWQREYGRWFVESLNLKRKRVLDVGCACGAILRGLGEASAVVQGVDVNEYMINLGRLKWPDMAGLMFVCDAVNLHVFADHSWDAIHSNQVAEHWKPELVPFILKELWRVSRPGAIFFCTLDTEELFARQNRQMEGEDPTHVCIRPMKWWHEQLAQAGWQDCSDEYQQPMRKHPESFLLRYDWDWFVARRVD
jgi:ADP-heptose:LPS heptosyltransferase/2-polyprenyl-3-methyl-5-hydroxy-6-metoxy-1,4-benzoquinol methylase